MSLPAVRERFSTEPVGTRMGLSVRRDGEVRTLNLVLRDLVPYLSGETVRPVS